MSNPYSWRFTSRLDLLPPGSVCLDLGAGGREHVGIVAMDLDRGDVLGDCLALPFRDDCADLILSQAVIEHVTDPQRAFDEMLRVLRPGGVLCVEVAFMQPVHMPPHHYFNVTPYGLLHLLRRWHVLETGTIGTYSQVIRAINKAVHARGRWKPQVSDPKHYERSASGVYAVAQKPV